MRVSPALSFLAAVEPVAADVDQPGELGIETRHVKKLSAPRFLSGEQGSKYSHRRVDAASHVGDGDRIAHRFALRLAGEAHHAGFCLGNDVVAGRSRLWRRLKPIARDGAIDQSGISRPKTVRIKATLLQRRERRLIDDEYVSRTNQLFKQLAAARMIVIQGERSLVAVCRQEIG